MSRLPYACFVLGSRSITVIVVWAQLATIIPSKWGGEFANFVVGLITFILFWPQFAVLAKRLHDANLRAAYGLIHFLPLVIAFFLISLVRLSPLRTPGVLDIWMPTIMNALQIVLLLGYLILAFVPGTRGPNRYGPDPLGRGATEDVF